MESYEKEHLKRLRQGLAECCVLLRKDGKFPLDGPGEIALYGNGIRHTVKGGTGSGEVNSRFFVTVEDGMRQAGFHITTEKWLDAYDLVVKEARKDFIRGIKAQARKHRTLAVLEGMGAVMPEPEYDLPIEGRGDTAVYVLSRICGEGSDRKAEKGDILLSDTEVRDILAVNRQYSRFMLVLNVGGPVDLTAVKDVKNILLLSQLGAETGAVLADLLLGHACPSGKLTDTWTSWQEYPSVGDFGNRDDTRYREGIFTGYRYFDSTNAEVLYPFGFGLGYTDFAVSDPILQRTGEEIRTEAVVENTGAFPGKETLQLYVSVPSGELVQPYQTLAAFAKTGELEPGEKEQVLLSFHMHEIASYSEERAAYILEKGLYQIRIGTSSRDTRMTGRIYLPETVVVRQVRNELGKPDFTDWSPDSGRGNGTETGSETGIVIEVLPDEIPKSTADYQSTEVSPDPFVCSLSDRELALFSVGAFESGFHPASMIGNASKTVAGAAGETSRNFRDRGMPPLVMADGPAGIRISRDYYRDDKGAHAAGTALPETLTELMGAPVKLALRLFTPKPPENTQILHQYCTAIPIGTAIAQSWNPEFAEMCGDIVGEEMEHFGIHLWLAPALNIHRDIRCGRNFEYYSEDPLVSGMFAAAITKAVQKHPGRGVVLKHFAANNQETNRYRNNSMVSERTMREIYLRGFAIAIERANPAAVMTSYNLLNGIHTSEREDLLKDILRGEFGFGGIVMTDWVVAMTGDRKSVYQGPDPAKVAAAGGGLFMPGGKRECRIIYRALHSGRLDRNTVRIQVSRVVRLIRQLAE